MAMLASTKRASRVPFLNQRHLQQINCIKISSIQQQETEQSLPLPKHESHLTLDTRYKYMRFYPPYRKFINRHKIIHRRTKTKPTKCWERVNISKVIRRVIPLPPKGAHEDAKTRHQVIVGVLDWMMEVSALMKVSKNAFYRAILILWAAAEAEGRLASSKRINELACAALAMGCKFECSQRNYLEDVFLVNYRRISKLEISHAEHCILKALDWNIPVHVDLEETLSIILEQWEEFLWDCGGKLQRALYIKCFQDGQLVGNLYVQVVYVLDFLVIRCHDWLQEGSFTKPILLSIYIIFSINAGDLRLDRFTLWTHFLKFVDYHELLPLDQMGKMKGDITKCCSQYRIVEALGEIPLGFTFEKLIKKKNEQFYIPKIECIL